MITNATSKASNTVAWSVTFTLRFDTLVTPSCVTSWGRNRSSRPVCGRESRMTHDTCKLCNSSSMSDALPSLTLHDVSRTVTKSDLRDRDILAISVEIWEQMSFPYVYCVFCLLFGSRNHSQNKSVGRWRETITKRRVTQSLNEKATRCICIIANPTAELLHFQKGFGYTGEGRASYFQACVFPWESRESSALTEAICAIKRCKVSRYLWFAEAYILLLLWQLSCS